MPARPAASPEADSGADALAALVGRVLMERFAPAAVVVDDSRRIVWRRGRMADYLLPSARDGTGDVASLLVPGLRGPLQAAMEQARRDNRAATAHGGEIERYGRPVPVRITAVPLHPSCGSDGLLLIAFEDTTPLPAVPAGKTGTREQSLEFELQVSREELRGSVEELAATSEQLRTVNEDLAAAYQELQTSGEDMQSLNKELTRVNRQLQIKVDELKAARADLANVIDATDLPTVFLGADLRIRRFTPSATRLFSLIAGDIGRPIGDIATRLAAPAADLRAEVAAVLVDMVPRQTEVAAGGGRWFMRQTKPYRGPDDRVDGVVVTFADVSRLKCAEQELRGLAAQLEQRVADRAAELQNEIRERLRAEEEARQRHAELAHVHRVYTAGELATALAHELNQPLAAIAGLSDTSLRQLRRGIVATDSLAENLEKISAQAQRAAGVIRELRSFLAKGTANRRRCDVNELVRVACGLVAADARAHGIAVATELADGLPQVLAEPIHIEQVLINLMRNGVEAIRDAGMADGRITVATREGPAGTVQVRVRDTGPGLDEQTARRVFEPFYTTKSKGLGMGLCISRTIVEAHQGELWVEPGRGGSFAFTLAAAPRGNGEDA